MQLIDLCGKAVKMEDIKSFEKGYRKYVFCPCFQQVYNSFENKSLWGKKNTITTTSFRYVYSMPYGAVLSDQEKPSKDDRYAIKTDGGFIVNKLVDRITSPVGNLVRTVQNTIGIDRSVNMDMRIWTRGQTLSITKWGDIPAKIIYADGRMVDVYPNTPDYLQLGQSITPTTKDVPTLEVRLKNNTTLVFFGDGIDLADVDIPYQALLTAFNAMELTRQKKKNPFAAPTSFTEKRIQSQTIANLTEASRPVIQMPQWKTTSAESEKK